VRRRFRLRRTTSLGVFPRHVLRPSFALKEQRN
jgi:hypothetical protein